MITFLRRRSGDGRTRSDVNIPNALYSAPQDLDHAFYKAYYPDLAGHDDGALVAHWKGHGRREGRFQNLKAAEAAVAGHPSYSRLPTNFSPFDYVALNRDLTETCRGPVQAALHYLDHGLGERRNYAAHADDAQFMAAYLKRHPDASCGHDPRLDWMPHSQATYLRSQGFLDTTFLKDFNWEFYAVSNGLMGAGLDRNACLFHFVETGLRGLLPIAPDLVFDSAFHRRRLGDAQGFRSPLNDADLYREWLSRADFSQYPPNHAMLMKDRFGVACGPHDVVDLAVYRRANQDLVDSDDDHLLEHVFIHGLFEKRASLQITPHNVLLLTRYGDYLQQTGDAQRADALYHRLAHFLPHQSRLNQQLGDSLYRNERFASAFTCYIRNIVAGDASKWGYLNASSCCEKLGDLKTAVSIMAAGCGSYPEDENLGRLRGEVAERFFAQELDLARAEALAGKIGMAQARVAAAAADCSFPADSAAPTRAVASVALFANTDLPQCTLYRVEQKAEQLVAAGYAVRIYDWNQDRTAFEREMWEHDAVIFYRIAAFPRISRIIHAARAAGLVTLYEVDDLIFDQDHFPEAFADYAGQIPFEEYVDIALGVPLFRLALQQCDDAIASTRPLAERLKPLVRRGRAFVHPNALGARHEMAIAAHAPHPGDDKAVTIFYGSGTKAHKLDVERILLPALEEIHRRFAGKVRFVMMGHKPRAMDGLPNVSLVPFTADVGTYWAQLGKADIALSVLRRSPVTEAKSEIKWLEAAMLGIPCVVSATETFEGVIEHGVDGLLAADADAFVEHITDLVRNPKKRHAMGAAAKAKALRAYGTTAMADNMRAIFDTVAVPAAERTRVLVVNVYYAPQAKGGATRVMIDNIRDLRALHAEEFEFEVFTTLEGGRDPYSIHVSSFEGVRTTAMVAGDYPEVDFAPQDEQAGVAFKRCVERFKPHLIHFHCIQRISASAVEVAIALAIPYLITAHDGWWIADRQFLFNDKGPLPVYDFAQPHAWRPKVAGTRVDRPVKLLPALRGAKAILAVSDPFAELYRSTGLTNVRSVPNGLPTIDQLEVIREETPLRDRSDTVRIAHLGGLERHKGFPLLRCAFLAARPRNITVKAVDLALDPGEEVLEVWGDTTVRLMARRHQREMARLYDEIDVLFAPSLWPESYGLVTREALAAGCWVVASDRGAVGEPVVDGVNGHIVSVDSVDGLVDVLRRIDADPGRYKRSPPSQPRPRRSIDQARDLAVIYREATGRIPAVEAAEGVGAHGVQDEGIRQEA